MRRATAIGFAIVLAAAASSGFPPATEAAQRGGVLVNGVAIPGAESLIDITVEVKEFREGGEVGPPHLIPGAKKYMVSIALHGRIQAFDDELPAEAQMNQFTVRAEDGRTFTGCLVVGLTFPGSGHLRRHVYGLRCQNVSR